jgi:tRNA(adenine34) deaminase
MGIAPEATDERMMRRCVELSRIAVSKSEYPFATVIALDDRIVAEAINRTVREGDVTRHAEILALTRAQQAVGHQRLRRHTLYTNVEPCAMCSYCIREAGIGRVVYAMGSPVMGGLSRWNILRDDRMSDRVPQIFDAAPEVVSGVLLNEAQQAWRDWSPLAWEMIKLRGVLTEPGMQDTQIVRHPAHRRSLWHYLQFLFVRKGSSLDKIDGPIADHSHL